MYDEEYDFDFFDDTDLDVNDYEDDFDSCEESENLIEIKKSLTEETDEKIKKTEPLFATYNYCHNICEFYKCCCANYDCCIKLLFNKAIDLLEPREKRILQFRYGYYCEIQNRSTIGKEVGLGYERVRQLESIILRKLRYPTRSKYIKPFIFDIMSCDPNGYYGLILKDLWNVETGFDILLGVDFTIVDKNKSSNKSPSQICDELNLSVLEFDELQPFNKLLNELKITTLNHLLHTSTEKLLNFSANDIIYFDLQKTISKMGYSFKCDVINNHIREILFNKLFSIIYNENARKERIIDLPLSTTLKLMEKKINYIGLLSEKFYDYNNNKEFSTEECHQINFLLLCKSLLLVKKDTGEIYSLTESRLSQYVNCLIDWLIENRLSIIELTKEINKRKLYWFQAVSYINNRFPHFTDSQFCNYASFEE